MGVRSTSRNAAAGRAAASETPFAALATRVIACRRCPRLISHCRHIAAVKRRAYLDWSYWGRPVPGFGDPHARVLVIGLAPGAHGANRTGRMFTGDGAGQTLMTALHATGFASTAQSTDREDGLILIGLYLTAAVRCAPPDNKPTIEEITRCRGYLIEELRLLPQVRVVVALGRLAHDAFLSAAPEAGIPVPRPRPAFAHGAEAELRGSDRALVLLDSYHPSRQNTQTGRLTPAMLEKIFGRADRLAQTAHG